MQETKEEYIAYIRLLYWQQCIMQVEEVCALQLNGVGDGKVKRYSYQFNGTLRKYLDGSNGITWLDLCFPITSIPMKKEEYDIILPYLAQIQKVVLDNTIIHEDDTCLNIDLSVFEDFNINISEERFRGIMHRYLCMLNYRMNEFVTAKFHEAAVYFNDNIDRVIQYATEGYPDD